MRVPASLPLSAAAGVSQAFLTSIRNMYQTLATALNNPQAGTTAERPVLDLVLGQTYFDFTLGIPIWWDSTQWVDASGAPV